ncbi:MAG: hypothetical protein OHK93_007460 [Ramalina farinacea]|uniref:FAS1 domain-containing protein n=1 Tax=Ramalina farinacea TaxID=258253 RepID=A0AA43QND9_9LECA|nr:hypothetical protein [Ramalina farinacea]
MKSMAHVLLFTSILQSHPTSGQSFLSRFLSKEVEAPAAAAAPQQKPIMNIPIPLPGSSNDNNDQPSTGSGDVIISDVIGKERSINIFAGFTRDVDSVSKRLEDQSERTTVLAPLNSQLQKLPRKPWEDPEDYETLGAEAYEGNDGEKRATRNLRRFVEAHTIPASPWKEGEKVDSMRGEKVWWESKDGKKVIQPGDIEVSSVAEQVSNGEVWVIKGCMNYA